MPLRSLLVDDDDAFLEAASVLLEREGVTVASVASNTAEALRQARALRPDVILVDIGLGDESGFDLACLLTRDGQDGQRVRAEVILISSYAEADYADLIADSPAAGFLPKSDLSAQAIGRILGRTLLAASRNSGSSASRGRRWAFAVVAGGQPWRGPMSDISQGLLQRRRDSGDTDWRNYAACLSVDPDLFFPYGTSGASLLQIDEAKQICRTCPVCGPCLRWALESGDAGVWGGTTEDERRKHRRRAQRVSRQSEFRQIS